MEVTPLKTNCYYFAKVSYTTECLFRQIQMGETRNTFLFYTGIGLVLTASFVFNASGVFWENLIHPYYLLLLLLLAGLLIHVFSTTALRLNRVDVGVLLILLYAFLSRFIILMDVFDIHTLLTLALMIYYLALRRFNWTESLVNRYVSILCTLAFVMATYGLCQYTGLLSSANIVFNITGTFANPGPYGGALAFMVPLPLIRYLKNTKYAPYGLLTIWVLVVVILTESRAALIAALLSLILSGAVYYGIRLRKWRWAVLALSLAMPILVILFSVKGMGSLEGRGLIWKIALTMLPDQPFGGIGYHFFEVEYLKYQAAYFATHDAYGKEAMLAGDTYYAFNEGLKWGVENGLTGVVLLVAVVAIALKAYRKSELTRNRELAGVWLAPMAALFVFGQFSYPLYFICFKVLLLIHVSIGSSYLYMDKTIEIRSRMIRYVPATIAGIALFAGYLSYQGIMNWKIATESQFQNASLARKKFEQAYPSMHHNGVFLYSYGSFLGKEHTQQTASMLDKAAETFSYTGLYLERGNYYQLTNRNAQAEEMYLTAAYMVPSKLETKEVLFDFYLLVGKERKATEWAENILRTPIQKPNYIQKKIRSKAASYLHSK